MSHCGKLIVFEGPDGVGKSTLSNALVKELITLGIPALYFAFPGKKEGTLGYHIYALHHNPLEFGITSSISPTSMQLLHIASHITAIENEILPALNQGKWVVLDRFWWSAWVYGLVNDIKESKLQKMLSIEHEYWGNVYPDITFLIQRTHSLKEEPAERWHKLHSEYNNIAKLEAQHYNVEIIKNNGPLPLTFQQIMQKVVNICNNK